MIINVNWSKLRNYIKKKNLAWWLKLVILVIQEAEIGRIMVPG
jgi:hypothetical protein